MARPDRLTALLIATLVAGLAGCGEGTEQRDRAQTPELPRAEGCEDPDWLAALADELRGGGVNAYIASATYQGETVYYVPPQGPDSFGRLYDACGSLLCAPDGGLTGRGNGPCSDFFAGDPTLTRVWQDEPDPADTWGHCCNARLDSCEQLGCDLLGVEGTSSDNRYCGKADVGLRCEWRGDCSGLDAEACNAVEGCGFDASQGRCESCYTADCPR